MSDTETKPKFELFDYLWKQVEAHNLTAMELLAAFYNSRKMPGHPNDSASSTLKKIQSLAIELAAREDWSDSERLRAAALALKYG